MQKRVICRDALFFMMMFLLLPMATMAGPANSFEMPDTGYTSNVVYDITSHDGGIWMATSKGLTFSLDNGVTWLAYRQANGLVSENISALFSVGSPAGQRLWIGSSHDEEIQEVTYSISDGVSFTDDAGDTWTQVNFDSLDIPYVWGGDRTVYDITGHYDSNPAQNDDWVFFAAFAGGLLASRDGGVNWRRIFPSTDDSTDYYDPYTALSLRNRYFSCVTDTSHGDTLSLYAGTAEGFFQYVFAEPWDKAYSKYINRIAFCDAGEDTNFVYLAGDACFTRGRKTGGPFISRFEADGLPGPYISAVIDFGGKIFVGTMDSGGTASTGLAVSTDFGDSFTAQSSLTEVIGANRRINDFAVIRNRIYMAAEQAGLFVSSDTGTTWQHLWVDTDDTTSANQRNVVHALNAWADTLRVGTDSGLVQLFMDDAGAVVSSRSFVFAEGTYSSTKVIRVKTQIFGDDSTAVIWTINRPLTASGDPIVGRSADGGLTWDTLQWTAITHDIAFWGDTAFVMGEEGLRFSADTINPSTIYPVTEYIESTAVDSLDADTITVMEVYGDTVYIGTNNGFAVTVDRGENWNIFRVNRDELKADAILHYTTDISGIVGDFIPAMDVQYDTPEGFARLWVSNRPAYGGYNGISAGIMIPVVDSLGDTLRFERLWFQVYDNFAWNFAFADGYVFAATNDGLIYASDTSVAIWDTLQLVDSAGNALVLPGSSVYAVEAFNGYLWVGTSDRAVRISLDDFTDQKAYYVEDPSDEVYAFPVPFSHGYDQIMDFHFVVKEDAYVTLEIYDFAMNLVRRVIDNQWYAAGIYPSAGAGRRTWDGYNGKGDKVAVGVYYFKVEYSTGEVAWGKLAVIP